MTKARRRVHRTLPARIQRLGTSARPAWSVEISSERRVPALGRPEIKQFMLQCLQLLEQPAPKGIRTSAMLPFPPASVRMLSLSFVGDPKMAELNAHYRGKERTTDVLSFPAILPSDYPELATDHGGYPLGDIVISLDTAAQQSRRYGWSLGEEIARLLVHGLLHLLGYDHEKVPPRQAALMRRVEKSLFGKVRGLAPGLVRRHMRGGASRK